MLKKTTIILGTPCYWGSVTGIMKDFFDRHTGYAMHIPEGANNFYKLKFLNKFKIILKELKNFGAKKNFKAKNSYM